MVPSPSTVRNSSAHPASVPIDMDSSWLSGDIESQPPGCESRVQRRGGQSYVGVQGQAGAQSAPQVRVEHRKLKVVCTQISYLPTEFDDRAEVARPAPGAGGDAPAKQDDRDGDPLCGVSGVGEH